jgi:hypothetical protein
VVSAGFGRAYALPNARFELIPGGGHLPMREAPDETFAAIDARPGPGMVGPRHSHTAGWLRWQSRTPVVLPRAAP